MITPSLGIEKYHYFLSRCNLLIGNTSSGIVESSSFKIPFINLGDRQKERYAPKNVLNSPFILNKIEKSYKKSKSKVFLSKIKKIKNPYKRKNTAKNICNIIFSNLKK